MFSLLHSIADWAHTEDTHCACTEDDEKVRYPTSSLSTLLCWCAPFRCYSYHNAKWYKMRRTSLVAHFQLQQRFGSNSHFMHKAQISLYFVWTLMFLHTNGVGCSPSAPFSCSQNSKWTHALHNQIHLVLLWITLLLDHYVKHFILHAFAISPALHVDLRNENMNHHGEESSALPTIQRNVNIAKAHHTFRHENAKYQTPPANNKLNGIRREKKRGENLLRCKYIISAPSFVAISINVNDFSHPLKFSIT